MRKIWKFIAVGSVGTSLLFGGDALAQDQSDFIRRMDTNGNGMIDPDESQGRARGMLERMAQSNPRINLSRPIPIEMLTREMDRMRTSGGGQQSGRGGGGGGNQGGGGFGGGGFGGGGFGGGNFGGGFGGGNQPAQTGGGNGQNGKNAAGNAVPTLIEGFGNEYNDTPVLGFGAGQQQNLSGIKFTEDDSARVERTLQTNDRNKDGVIEGEEITKGRWTDGEPKLYDTNRDGRLTNDELLMRAAKKRVADEAAAKAEQEQRGRDRDQRGGDRGGGDRGGGRFGMFGGGDFGGGGFGGGGFGGGAFGGGGFGGRGGGGFGGGGFGGRGGMTFGPPGAEGGMAGGPPGGNMTMMMAPGGEGGGRGGGRGGRGGDQGENGGRGGPPGMGGGGPETGGPEMGAPGMGGRGEFGGGDFGGGRGGRGGRGGGEEGGGFDASSMLENAFTEADENKSGSLEKEEWDNLRRVNGEDLDKDKNSIITKQEYFEVVGEKMGIKVDPSKWAYKPTGPMTYRAKEPKEKYPDVPGWFWNEDKDGDGQVSMAEHSSNWNDARIAEWLKLDTNGDGMMSRQEAIASTKPAPSGIVTTAPKVAPENQPRTEVAANGQGQSDRSNGGRNSRNNENAQPAPAIDPEQAKEMKANRDKRWDRVGSEPAAAAPAAAASASGELPADLPDSIDKAKAQRSAKFFAQSDKNKDGFLTTEEMEDAKEADKNNDGKADLKEWIIYKAS